MQLSSKPTQNFVAWIIAPHRASSYPTQDSRDGILRGNTQ